MVSHSAVNRPYAAGYSNPHSADLPAVRCGGSICVACEALQLMGRKRVYEGRIAHAEISDSNIPQAQTLTSPARLTKFIPTVIEAGFLRSLQWIKPAGLVTQDAPKR